MSNETIIDYGNGNIQRNIIAVSAWQSDQQEICKLAHIKKTQSTSKYPSAWSILDRYQVCHPNIVPIHFPRSRSHVLSKANKNDCTATILRPNTAIKCLTNQDWKNSDKTEGYRQINLDLFDDPEVLKCTVDAHWGLVFDTSHAASNIFKRFFRSILESSYISKENAKAIMNKIVDYHQLNNLSGTLTMESWCPNADNFVGKVTLENAPHFLV